MIAPKSYTNPFPGLRPFEMDEYRLFFGREGQSDALVTRLQRARFLAVVGTSGSGKSSLVRAGLLPALRGGMMAGAGSGWRICIMRPGNDPFGNLAHWLAEKGVLPEAGGGLPPAEAEAVIEATLRRGSLGLVDAAQHARLAEHEKLLVVVDQFEELFRFRAARAATSTGDDASAFVKLLLEAARQREFSLYVVLTMRSDFLGDCAQFQGLPEAINEGQYLIPRMTRDERRMAITGPVGVTRGKMAEPLINRLLNDVGDNPDQLPILQHALMRTWDYWAAHRRNGEPLGLEHYETIGTMADALSHHADEAWDELPDERSRHVAEKLFKALTEKGADNREIRRPTQLSETSAAAEVTEDEVVAVIEVFRREGRSFLMPPAGVELSSDTVIDISHESLIRNWDRLQKWVDEEAQSARIYRRLAEAAVLHREGKEGLLIDPALQIALEWREQHKPNRASANRYHSEFETAIGFLDASREHRDAQLAAEREREQRELERARDFAEKQARSARRLRWLTAGMAVMFLLSLATAGYAFATRMQAINLRDDAVKQRTYIASLLESEKAERQKASSSEKRAENESKIAQGERDKAVKASKAALDAQGHAKKEAERANTQARIAGQNLLATEEATTAASSVVRRAIPIASQGDLLRKGIEAYKREELDEALGFFNDLRKQLQAIQPGATTQAAKRNLTIKQLQDFAEEIGKLEQFSMQLGWTLSNIGATHLKRNEVPAAIESYKMALAVFTKLPDSGKERILLETYLGLGLAYHAVAMSSRTRAGTVDKSKSQEDFKKAGGFKDAEDFFKLALAFEENQVSPKPSEVATAYSNLARHYVDTGNFDEAEANFKRAVERRYLNKKSSELESRERDALAAALRELGELYQGLEDRYDDAVRVFNEMIIVQEDITVSELVDQGQAIANSYSDLGQIYAARGDAAMYDAKSAEDADRKKKAEEEAAFYLRKAEDSLRAANLLQRTALKLRQMGKSQAPLLGGSALVIGLTAELDELGDAYAKLGKFPDAEAIYLESLGYRDSNNEQRKSYEKLTKFYRTHKKDPGKAEEYNKLLVDTYKAEPRSIKYDDALVLLAQLYSEDPNKSSDAESTYRQALDMSIELDDWQYQNLILFRLVKLYEKQKRVPEREQVLRRRLDTLTKYFKRLDGPAGSRPKNPVTLVSEYLYAINALAYFYVGKNDAKAEAAYERAFEASRYITSNIFNEKILDFYAATLEDYQKLLKKLEKQSDPKLLEVTKAVRDYLHQLRQSEDVRERQNVQRASQGPSTSAQ